MGTGNTLMVRDIQGRTYFSNNDNNGLNPKPWWILVIIFIFIILEILNWIFFR